MMTLSMAHDPLMLVVMYVTAAAGGWAGFMVGLRWGRRAALKAAYSAGLRTGHQMADRIDLIDVEAAAECYVRETHQERGAP